MGPEGYNSATLFPMLKLKTLALDLDVLCKKWIPMLFIFWGLLSIYVFPMFHMCLPSWSYFKGS
jgi:hypothetical protein